MIVLSTTADDILACARALILRGGYNGFSYADIAEVVGIRKASIHHHFPTKVDLVQVLVSRYRDEARAGLAALDSQAADPLKRLTTYVGYWQACIADASASFCVCALLSAELPALPPQVAAEVRTHFRSLSDWLTAAFEEGAGRDLFKLQGTARMEAEGFMATVHGAMLSARAYDRPETFKTITDALIGRLSS